MVRPKPYVVYLKSSGIINLGVPFGYLRNRDSYGQANAPASGGCCSLNLKMVTKWSTQVTKDSFDVY